MVLNRLESLPEVTADSKEKDIQENLELIEYLHAQYVQDKARTEYDFERMKPHYLKKQRDDTSSHSENEEGGTKKASNELPSDLFSRQRQIQQLKE